MPRSTVTGGCFGFLRHGSGVHKQLQGTKRKRYIVHVWRSGVGRGWEAPRQGIAGSTARRKRGPAGEFPRRPRLFCGRPSDASENPSILLAAVRRATTAAYALTG